MSEGRVVEVLLPLPFDHTFSYIYEGEEEVLFRRVIVPFRWRRLTGLVVEERRGATDGLKRIEQILDEEPIVEENFYRFWKELLFYYHIKMGSALKFILPGWTRYKEVSFVRLKRGVENPPLPQEVISYLRGYRSLRSVRKKFPSVARRLKKLEEDGIVEVRRFFRGKLIPREVKEEEFPPSEVVLTEEQKDCVERVKASLGSSALFLLFGPPASGKTEVYIEIAKEVISRGKNVIVLVPEILLATHLIERYRKRLGKRVLPFHSYMKEKERGGVLMATEGGGYVIIGPKSLILSPVKNLGLIVVDEEHDFSYKNEGEVPYHARQAAIMRGRVCGIPVLLGTATPSVDTWFMVKRGEISLLRLTKKFGTGGRPEVELLSLKGKRDFIQQKVLDEISSTVRAGRQVIVLINRRGYASFLICRECGWVPYCERCSISLNYHKRKRTLLCHYCGYKREPPHTCERCGEAVIQERGWGTERVEEYLSGVFPEMTFMRIDSDTVKNWMEMKEELKKFEEGRADVLIGTQMVGKGLDIPKVGLVAVLNVENAFLFPDFRAGERTFQLLTQVIGRAGRMDKGKAIVQAHNIYHPAIQKALRGEVERFLDEELERRRGSGYPPFSHFCLLKVKSKDSRKAETVGKQIKDALSTDVFIKGPAPALIMKMRGFYVWHLLLFHPERENVLRALEKIDSLSLRGARVEYDPDPVNFS